ncbi:DUF4270 family protein [Spirosoma flavum]|uniref:DUF4270 family protein n=1 Tax=Spirosoma flavum TaxID=2048557 RepID=A0ABW6AF37_9BACT
MRTLWYAGLLWLAGIVLFACQSGDLNVGQSVINPQELTVQSVDSVTIQTSTVMRTDSFLTSGDANIAVGYWNDAQVGKQSAQSFAALDYPGNSLVSQTNLRLDSLVLELGYSFTYGDTTSAFDMSVYRLSKPMPAQVYYSTSTIGYDTKPLMQNTFVPHQLSGTRLVQMRVPTDLAQGLYDKLISGEIADNITLNDFLAGFAFISKSTANTFVGFTTSPTVSGMRLYYHDTDVNKTAATLLFPITSLHFTKLQNDRTGTPLSALKNRSDAVSSRLTDRTTFVSVGAGLQTRIEFPYLNGFFRPETFADLNRALLIISPVRRDLLDNNPPPVGLQLYQTNNQNELIATIPGGTTGSDVAGAGYSIDRTALLLNDAYTIDLTYYIGQIIKKKALSQPLLLTIPSSSTGFTVKSLLQRVTLGDQLRPNDQVQLKLFMTSGT